MFIYSEIHDWQGDPAVKQVLVFPSYEAKTSFEKLFKAEVDRVGIPDANENNKGVVYKLRAAKDSNGKFIPVIRCGMNGLQLYEGYTHYEKFEDAILDCVKELRRQIYLSIDKFVISRLIKS